MKTANLANGNLRYFKPSRFACLDFETANRSLDSACAIGIVHVEENKIQRREYHLIRPLTQKFEFSYIHGITWHDVVNEPTFDQLWPSIENMICDVDFVAAHNASFDQGVLHACCDAHKIPRPECKFICTVKLARATWNIFPTKLPNVCEYLGIHLNHHHALSDAEACAHIVLAANQHKLS